MVRQLLIDGKNKNSYGMVCGVMFANVSILMKSRTELQGLLLKYGHANLVPLIFASEDEDLFLAELHVVI